MKLLEDHKICGVVMGIKVVVYFNFRRKYSMVVVVHLVTNMCKGKYYLLFQFFEKMGKSI